jgi:hypothetical protein
VRQIIRHDSGKGLQMPAPIPAQLNSLLNNTTQTTRTDYANRPTRKPFRASIRSAGRLARTNRPAMIATHRKDRKFSILASSKIEILFISSI